MTTKKDAEAATEEVAEETDEVTDEFVAEAEAEASPFDKPLYTGDMGGHVLHDSTPPAE